MLPDRIYRGWVNVDLAFHVGLCGCAREPGPVTCCADRPCRYCAPTSHRYMFGNDLAARFFS